MKPERAEAGGGRRGPGGLGGQGKCLQCAKLPKWAKGFMGPLRGDLVRPHRRQVNGRQMWAEMPPGAFYVEDREKNRVIYAGHGIGQDSYMVLYRNLEGGWGAHRMRILQGNETNATAGTNGGRRELIPTRATMSEAMRDLWQWVRGRQSPRMVIVEGELSE